MTQDHEAAHGERPRSSSSQSYPADRFDNPRATRVGAHRVKALPRVGWHFVLAGLIGAALLTTLGIIGVTILNSTGTLPPLPSNSQGPLPAKARPALDPSASVVILDGTSATGDVAMRLSDEIGADKLGTVIFAGPAATSDVAISAVFYSDPADEPAALGLAEKLGGVSSYQSGDYTSYGARLVVLIGADYAGPGKTAS